MDGDGYKRHKWSNEIKAEVKRASIRDNWHWFLQVGEDFLVIILAALIPYLLRALVGRFATPGWATAAWITSYWVISVVVIGCRQRALAELLHQSAHKTLAANPTLNFVAGTFFSGYLVVQSWSVYLQSHVFRHHLRFGGEVDPDYQYHIGEGLYDGQSDAQFTWRYLISPMLLRRTPSKIVDLFRNRFFSPEEPRWEKWLKLTYLVGLVLAFVASGYGREFFLFWVVPYIVAFPIVNWYVELMEHFPLVRGGTKDIYLSRNRWTGLLGKFLTGVHHEHLHLVHHLFPGVPAWRLPHVHGILMRDPEYKAIQDREVGLVLPVVWGIPSILGSIARNHPHPSDPSDGQTTKPTSGPQPAEQPDERKDKAA